MSSVKSSLNSHEDIIDERTDSESDELNQTDYKKRRQIEEKKIGRTGKGDSKSSHLYTITNNTNIIYNSAFPNLKTEKVANRLVKRKMENTSEIGYLNFPNRSAQKISQMSNEPLMKKNMARQNNEILQKSAGIGGALTQFKKKKQRRMIKQMMNEDNSG
eukprot:CAMPEP_0197019316 /NCGR_PEP_ID=MMETSP1380-20130617/80629_1 /TAXON_ID=5936 /ORGANISM="Euplotes crassus, Strain CT5" /LENGTH=159 /DNA_ID=CAMNT_0042446709 /DNA_START=181 /DNA_END=658 /DNA_ORIENTATION=-